MDKEMKALLQAAAVTGRLPIVRFELRSSKDRELISTALRDVWMTGPDDGMALVKARAARIAEAAQAGLAILGGRGRRRSGRSHEKFLPL